MKATIIAIIFTFTAAGMMSSEAEARPNRRSYKKARSNRSDARTRRTRVVNRRQPARRNYRAPARRNYRKPVRRNYRKPVRRNYRKPVRNYRKPVRNYRKPHRNYRRPVARYYRPGYRSVVKTVTLTNSHSFTIRVAVRAGYSASCMANPVQSRQYLAPGTSVSVSTHGSYVCYRRLPTQYTAGSGWFSAVINSSYMRLWF